MGVAPRGAVILGVAFVTLVIVVRVLGIGTSCVSGRTVSRR